MMQCYPCALLHKKLRLSLNANQSSQRIKFVNYILDPKFLILGARRCGFSQYTWHVDDLVFLHNVRTVQFLLSTTSTTRVLKQYALVILGRVY